MGKRLSPEEFADAFTAHGRALWCIAVGVVRRRDLADDVLQEGAMVALRKLDQFEADTSFLAWMGRIVRYVALNQARRSHRRDTTPIDPALLADVTQCEAGLTTSGGVTTSLGALADGQQCFDDEVLHALDSLDETARSCLLLRTLLDMPYRQISLALDMPEGTAMSHVHRARKSLRDQLRDREPGKSQTAKQPRDEIHRGGAEARSLEESDSDLDSTLDDSLRASAPPRSSTSGFPAFPPDDTHGTSSTSNPGAEGQSGIGNRQSPESARLPAPGSRLPSTAHNHEALGTRQSALVPSAQSQVPSSSLEQRNR